jgi:hypothetical protein
LRQVRSTVEELEGRGEEEKSREGGVRRRREGTQGRGIRGVGGISPQLATRWRKLESRRGRSGISNLKLLFLLFNPFIHQSHCYSPHTPYRPSLALLSPLPPSSLLSHLITLEAHPRPSEGRYRRSTARRERYNTTGALLGTRSVHSPLVFAFFSTDLCRCASLFCFRSSSTPHKAPPVCRAVNGERYRPLFCRLCSSSTSFLTVRFFLFLSSLVILTLMLFSRLAHTFYTVFDELHVTARAYGAIGRRCEPERGKSSGKGCERVAVSLSSACLDGSH